MVYFQAKNPNFGKFWRSLGWKLLIYLEYFTDIRNILCPFGTFCVHLVHSFPVLVSCSKNNLATLFDSCISKTRPKDCSQASQAAGPFLLLAFENDRRLALRNLSWSTA
jgi:hypothetical protein